jgi:hypothetical protein
MSKRLREDPQTMYWMKKIQEPWAGIFREESWRISREHVTKDLDNIKGTWVKG